MYFVEVEDEVELAYVLERSVEGLDKDLNKTLAAPRHRQYLKGRSFDDARHSTHLNKIQDAQFGFCAVYHKAAL